MYKNIYVFFVALFFVSACASPQPSWRKAGVTPNDAHSALAQCKYDVGINKVADNKEKELVQNCMESKGFRWTY